MATLNAGERVVHSDITPRSLPAVINRYCDVAVALGDCLVEW